MKNIVLLFCCLMTHAAVCMEPDKPNASCNNVTYKDNEQILIDDCKDQLKKRLEIYKTSNDF